VFVQWCVDTCGAAGETSLTSTPSTWSGGLEILHLHYWQLARSGFHQVSLTLTAIMHPIPSVSSFEKFTLMHAACFAWILSYLSAHTNQPALCYWPPFLAIVPAVIWKHPPRTMNWIEDDTSMYFPGDFMKWSEEETINSAWDISNSDCTTQGNIKDLFLPSSLARQPCGTWMPLLHL